jgi:quercetin dioxygenase-like cupin family protein
MGKEKIVTIENVPFTVTDWDKITPVEFKGDKGTSFWRTFESGNVRVRMVVYSPGFKSDHWCERGHILLVLEGELIIHLKDGNKYALKSGTSFQAGDDKNNPHMAQTKKKTRVFIVD